MYRIKPRCHNKRLKRKTRNDDQKYFILLPDQTCLIGKEFQVMKSWKHMRKHKNLPIVDMFQTSKRINAGVTSLSKFIEFDPRQQNSG